MKEDSLYLMGALLHNAAKGSMELPGVNTLNIHGAYFPLCPLEGSHRCDPFIFSKDEISTFPFKVCFRV